MLNHEVARSIGAGARARRAAFGRVSRALAVLLAVTAAAPLAAASALQPPAGQPRRTQPPTTPSTPTQQTAERQSASQGADKLAVTQAEYNGWKTFAVNCTRCHGDDAIGSALAPSLVKSLQGNLTREAFIQTVTHGRLDKGMPAWGPLLTPQRIDELYQYLKARSDGRLAPGRPHVKAGR